MMCHLVTEDTFIELGILQEKTEAVLRCIMDDSTCKRAQIFADIASDYLSEMDETIRVMQENKLTTPLSPGRKTSP